MITIYLATLAVGLLYIIKFLAPEFNIKFPTFSIPKHAPKPAAKPEPQQAKPISVQVKAQAAVKEAPKAPVVNPLAIVVEELQEKVTRLDYIISEKNKEIERLQVEVRTQNVRREDFEKLREIMEEEIQSLRKENRTLKLEFGIQPTFTSSID